MSYIPVPAEPPRPPKRWDSLAPFEVGSPDPPLSPEKEQILLVELKKKEALDGRLEPLVKRSIHTIVKSNNWEELGNMIQDAGRGLVPGGFKFINEEEATTRWSPLCYAALYGHDACALMLLNNGALVDKPTPAGETPLILAAKGGWLNIVKLLIERNCHINSVDNEGDSALSHACMHGRVNVCEYLIRHGIDHRMRNKAGLKAFDLMTNMIEYEKRRIRLLPEQLIWERRWPYIPFHPFHIFCCVW